MQNYIYNAVTCVVSSMARLTVQGDALPAHLSRFLKMFLKHTEKSELKEISELNIFIKITFSVYIKVIHTYTIKNPFMP